jgi:hypothetical protein
MGQGVLSHYNLVAGLDGKASTFTQNDLLQLAGQDRHGRSISLFDWKNVLA